MAKIKVKLQDQVPPRVVFLDPDATVGATLGVDFRMPNGSLATKDKLLQYLGLQDNRGQPVPGGGGSTGPTAHRLLTGLALGNDHPQYVRYFLRPVTFINESGLTVPINDVYLSIPSKCVIENVRILTIGGPGDCVIDIRRSTFAAFPPIGGDSICGATKPTIASDIKYEDTTFTGWTTVIDAGDILAVVLESVVTFTLVQVNIQVRQLTS